MECREGTYQDSPFHKDDTCKNCSGTDTSLVLEIDATDLEYWLGKIISKMLLLNNKIGPKAVFRHNIKCVLI